LVVHVYTTCVVRGALRLFLILFFTNQKNKKVYVIIRTKRM
jgi:hypothetical protein